MYPLIELGPLRLSSGGLLLLAALWFWSTHFEGLARRRGGTTFAAQASACMAPLVFGALPGGRLWHGLFNLDLYAIAPGLWLALPVSGLAWPGALLGGLAAGWWFARQRDWPLRELADTAALALPLPLAIASAGLLLSGEAFGLPSRLPWAVTLFGTARHPTQLYYALAALCCGAVLWLAARRVPALPAGSLALIFLVLHGLTMLLLEALRADSLTIAGGLRSAQFVGLALLLAGLRGLRRLGRPAVS